MRLCNDVFGHDNPRAYFQRALASGRISHAYLLVGPRGVGKTRFARGVAMSLLCGRPGAAEDGDQIGACGTCASCGLLPTGNHPAFLELVPEPGKAIDIDSVRGINAALSLRASERRRVVMLDDADRLNVPAANALLKILEEPPPGTVFLLVSSRPSYLLPTIHSRCHRVPFGYLAPDDFHRALDGLGFAPELRAALNPDAPGAPGVAASFLTGVEACGGVERYGELLAGAGADRPETLIDYLPGFAKEKKRDHVRRFLELVIEGVWGQRERAADAGAEVVAREFSGKKALAFAGLLEDLDGNVNPELVLEQAATLLRSS